jgi:hypothetical protein
MFEDLDVTCTEEKNDEEEKTPVSKAKKKKVITSNALPLNCF